MSSLTKITYKVVISKGQVAALYFYYRVSLQYVN